MDDKVDHDSVIVENLINNGFIFDQKSIFRRVCMYENESDMRIRALVVERNDKTNFFKDIFYQNQTSC